MIPLEIQVNPIPETCPFPNDSSLGAVSDVPAVYYMRVGGLATSHTQNTPLLRREGTKQCLLEYLNLALSAKHPRPEFEWTNPKESSVLNSAMLPIIHMISGPPAGQTRCPYNGNRWF